MKRWRARFYCWDKTHWIYCIGRDRFEATTAAKLIAPPHWDFQQITEVLPSLKVKPRKHWTEFA